MSSPVQKKKNRGRAGKSGEHIIYALLNDIGFDVYTPLVDDQGVDGVIRLLNNAGNRVFVDFQVKSAKDKNRFAGVVQDAISAQDDTFLCLFIRRTDELIESFYTTKAQLIAVGSETSLNNPVFSAELERQFKKHQSLKELYRRLCATADVEVVDVSSFPINRRAKKLL